MRARIHALAKLADTEPLPRRAPRLPQEDKRCGGRDHQDSTFCRGDRAFQVPQADGDPDD